MATRPDVERKSRAEDAEWEVLPPESKDRKPVEPLFRLLSLFMDNLIRIPGTQIRFGIDPLLGLIPGVGDTGAAFVSALALVQAARQGLPKIVLARMSLNILINELIGIVPLVGDAFSFWFKSNARNHALIKQHLSEGHAPRRSQRSDWIFVISVLVALALIVGLGITITLYVLGRVLQYIGLV
jgi:hypothetical protein